MLELASPADWEHVNRLSVQVHDLHAAFRPDIYYSCPEPYSKADFLAHIAEKRVYVAKLNGIVAGYLVLSFYQKGGSGTHEKKGMRLDSICVDQILRGHGIGRAMIADLRALAKAFGCAELILGVHPENDEAIAFYQSCGFTIRTIHMEMRNL